MSTHFQKGQMQIFIVSITTVQGLENVSLKMHVKSHVPIGSKDKAQIQVFSPEVQH
jgi:hypothetical protein